LGDAQERNRSFSENDETVVCHRVSKDAT
jgi:hypothetical protein